jgi:hypothetical protein
MLDHLLNFEPEVLDQTDAPLPMDEATPVQEVDAKIATADWLKQMGVPDDSTTIDELDRTHARQAFTALTTAAPLKEQKELISKIETPAAVRHLTGMLTAYDWEFVEQARELRGYAVAKILEECENTSASIRLKALSLLGKVTEVGLFTEKIEVKQAPASDAELDQRIKDKLSKFMGVIDVIDVSSEDKRGAETDSPDKA